MLQNFQFPSFLNDVALAISEVGGIAFLVGGCVRDHFMGVEPKDFDVEVFGLDEPKLRSILQSFGEVVNTSEKSDGSTKQNSFPVLLLRGVEFALARTERKTGEGHGAFTCELIEGLDTKLAASRRDITINAMMVNILTGELIDHFAGLNDLRFGVIRHTSERFAEDPLRVLRVMQFAARFGFTVSRETILLCSNLLDTFNTISVERVVVEFEKMVDKGTDISKGLQFLSDCGWAKHFAPLFHTPKEVTIPKNLTLPEKMGLFLGMFASLEKNPSLELNNFLGRFKFSNEVKNISLELVSLLETWDKVRGKSGAVLAMRKKLAGLKIEFARMFHPFAFFVREHCNLDGDFLGDVRSLEVQFPREFWKRLVTGDDLEARGWKQGKEMGAELARLFDLQLENLLERDELLRLIGSPK